VELTDASVLLVLVVSYCVGDAHLALSAASVAGCSLKRLDAVAIGRCMLCQL
jgi:hypothetical protein